MNTEVSSATTSVVLLYHRLGLPKLASLVAGQYVAPALFNSELNYLSSRAWKCITLSAIIEDMHTGAKPQENTFAITFDDGYKSVYEHAFPALVNRKMSATIYIVADAIGGINEWDRKAGDYKESMMSESEIREMSDAGFEIGSHTLSHPHLSDLPDDVLEREIADSKHRLEDLIGKPVVSFSYPYGDYDNRVLSAAVNAGYENAVVTKLGVIVAGTSLFEIPRVNVRWNAVGPLLMRKIARARRASGLK